MYQQRFSIKGKWDVIILYDVDMEQLSYVAGFLRELHCPEKNIRRAIDVLCGVNHGVTFSCMDCRTTLCCIGHASDDVQFHETIQHEIDHIQAHVCKFYGCELGTEEAAYLQQFISSKIRRFLGKY